MEARPTRLPRDQTAAPLASTPTTTAGLRTGGAIGRTAQKAATSALRIRRPSWKRKTKALDDEVEALDKTVEELRDEFRGLRRIVPVG